jgi:hypothetical protein
MVDTQLQELLKELECIVINSICHNCTDYYQFTAQYNEILHNYAEYWNRINYGEEIELVFNLDEEASERSHVIGNLTITGPGADYFKSIIRDGVNYNN